MSSFDGRYLTDFSNRKGYGLPKMTSKESRFLWDHQRGPSERYTAPSQVDPGEV